MKEAIGTVVLAMEAFRDLEKYLKTLRKIIKNNNTCNDVPSYRNRPAYMEGKDLEMDIAVVNRGLKRALRAFRALDVLLDGGDENE